MSKVGGTPRRGSAQSDSQIAFAVRDRRMVIAHVPYIEPIYGYVLGVDDYHWVVVDRVQPDEVHLIHKSSPCLTITQRTLDDESSELQDRLGPMLDGYRDHVLKHHF